MDNPKLATFQISPNETLTVYGGLQHLKGNAKPYFSVTGGLRVNGRLDSAGCLHELILKHLPRFDELVSLHLSDIDGVPMHAEANGWYWLAGALPEHAKQTYHGGNSKGHFPKPDGAVRKGDWDTTDYRFHTEDESLEVFSRHVRVTMGAAWELRQNLIKESLAGSEDGVTHDWKRARAMFGDWIKGQEERWKGEAESCIRRYGLVVFGDGAKYTGKGE